MAIRVMHTGDWHLGNYNGPEKDGVNERFVDLCCSIATMISVAEGKRPDIAVIAGDVFHQARVWSDRGLREQETAVYFIRKLSTICPVVVMRGTPNHDSEEQFNMLKSVFNGDKRVRIVTVPEVFTVETDAGNIQVACLPGFDRGIFRAKHPGLSKEEENITFTKMVEDLIIGLKAQCNAEDPAMLVGHYTIAGCNMESGQTPFLASFEPIVYPATLAAADFDLVCFGHIHRPQKIEGCAHTYYCGAVMQLNFNDEGQERGFWIHDVEKGKTKSEFYQTPSRQFMTIRLEDADIAAIDEQGPEYLDTLPRINGGGAAEKIVRILYNCTDEHNKAFNHAETEKWLRGPGDAFWVSEISPQKITITADKRSMDAEGTPEGNLREYLEEAEKDPEQIGRLMELAMPIISEATERAKTERKTGMFVPLEIEVRNYRNFREEKFNFEDITFCTINGENGVGKSSLFMDAILDALFEEPREGDLTGWICNDPEARSGSIKLTFRLGDATYRVTRTRQKRGGPTLNISELVDGEWVDRSCEKMKDTQAEIENIIGMDSLTLKACALIMQDQYGLFLQADKEARMNILGKILGLGIYGDMEELAAEACTDTNRSVRNLSDRIDLITGSMADPEELEAQRQEARAKRKAAELQITGAQHDLDKKKVALNTQREAEERVKKINGKLASLGAEKAAKAAQMTAQMWTSANAATTLKQEEEITAGVAEHKSLLEQEKELIAKKAAAEAVQKEIDRLVAESEKAFAEMGEAEHKEKETARRIEELEKKAEEKEEAEIIHEAYEEIVARIAKMEAAKPSWEEKKAAAEKAQKDRDTIEADRDRKIAKLTQRIETLKAKVKLLEDSGCPIAEKATCRFLADAQEAKEELPKAEEELEQVKKEYEIVLQTYENVLSTALNDLKGEVYSPEALDSLRASQSAREPDEKFYRKLQEQIKELELLKERAGELAAETAKKTEAWKKACEQLQEKRGEYESYEGIEAEYEEVQKRIAETAQWLEKEKELPVAREQKAAAEARISELEREVDRLEAEEDENRSELEAEKGKLVGKEALEAEVESAEAEIKALQEQEKAADRELGGIERELESLLEKEQETEELRKQVNAEAEKAAGYEELKKAFSQDGIPHNIIRSIIPIFEATATNILGQMSGGKMSVELVTEKTLKSNKQKEVTTLDIIINDSDTGRLPYMSRSGGERVKAALSVILALSEIKSTKAGVQMGFLFIDEPPFLDAQGIQAYCDALEAVQKRYSSLKVMAITHDPAMKSRFPQSVDVIKTPEGSKVVY